MELGKKITVYLAEGLPKGGRSVQIDQWSGKAVCIPRNRLQEMTEFFEIENVVCIYFLIGESESGGLLRVYVGEADGFRQRISDHIYKKDWWRDVVIFFSQDRTLTKAGIQYLEHVCFDRLNKAGRCNLENNNKPGMPSVPKEDKSGLEVFYENIVLIMPLIGYDIFIQSGEKQDDKLQRLYCQAKGIKAEGILLNDGKIKVIKGSEAVLENVKSFETHPYRPLKDELVKKGRLVERSGKLIFADDYVFDSPSAAAAVILARSSSGPATWKTKDGKLLKELFEKELG